MSLGSEIKDRCLTWGHLYLAMNVFNHVALGTLQWTFFSYDGYVTLETLVVDFKGFDKFI